MDPKTYVGISEYATFGNNPILNVDPDGALFFGAFGSSSDQRKAARSFQKEHGGEIKNYWKKDISVKYQSSYSFGGYFNVNIRNQQFNKDGGLINQAGEIREHVPGAMERWSKSEDLVDQIAYNLADGFYVTGQNLFTKHFSESGQAFHLAGGITNVNENIDAFVTAGTTFVPMGGAGAARVVTKGKYVNLANPGRTAHIIAGDATGGGHAWFGSLKSFSNGLFNPKKSMFPVTWRHSKIMHAVSDVVVNNQWVNQTGAAGAIFTRSGQPAKFVVEGTYQGLKIRVITTYTDIITAFPIK